MSKSALRFLRFLVGGVQKLRSVFTCFRGPSTAATDPAMFLSDLGMAGRLTLRVS